MAELITAQRGTRDVLPPETAVWQLIEDTARERFKRYRYLEVRTPVFEATELFARGIGEATDIVSKEMYSFEDRGGRSVTLRPEGTAGVVRAYLQGKLSNLPSPVKLWYAGPMFRYERPQAGRQRQFHQIGVEALGSADPRTDAEVIALAMDLFAALQVGSLRVELNSLGCENDRPLYRQRLQEYFASRHADYCATCRIRAEQNPLRVLDCKIPECRELNREAPSIQDVICDDCRAHQDSLLNYLRELGIALILNPRLVRGLDYYTRTVFEIIASEKLGSQDTVCAGGRYDKLVEEVGGPPTPAVGWALGMERLVILMGDRVPDERIDCYVVALDGESEPKAFKLAHELRERGLAVEINHSRRKLDKHIAQASRLGARWMVLVGSSELARGEVQLKDLEARSQRSVSLDAGIIAKEILAP